MSQQSRPLENLAALADLFNGIDRVRSFGGNDMKLSKPLLVTTRQGSGVADALVVVPVVRPQDCPAV